MVGARRFSTVSDMEVEPLYTADDLPPDAPGRIGLPGEFPFTRGVYPSMYRGRLWTMRQFAGFGTAEDTNERFHFLLEHGQTGLSTAFDMPTLMGYDADHPRALGEVGREGVTVSSLADVRALFRGIDLGVVTTSMTVNCTASVLLAMYLAVAEEQGVPWTKLGGTIQNDMLKEFIAQKEWICPPEPSLRIVVDMIEFCAREAPRWHPVSISGYHIREAGSTAVQELAFTLADGIAYVEAAVRRGLAVDDFAPRLSFFFDLHNDFLEEIAKLRAARRLWATVMRDRFGAEDPRSLRLRTHAQTAARRSATALKQRGARHRAGAAACWAVSSRCTRIPSTRPSRYRARRPLWWRSARSRSWPRRAGSRTSSIPSAEASPSRRSPTACSATPGPTSTASIAWAAWCAPSSRASRSARSRMPPTPTSSRSIAARRRWWASTATRGRRSGRRSCCACRSRSKRGRPTACGA
jgi:methylmalonyl-CoA mutase N-terminal domain/subunit